MIYRSTGGANRKRRPAYFDKLVSVLSLIRSAVECPDDVELIFVNDGPMTEPRLRVMEQYGSVVSLAGIGNSASYRRAVSLVASENWPDTDIVYLCEDDYLHVPRALTVLVKAAEAIPRGSYFGLYDHPDRQARAQHPARGAASVLVGPNDWQPVESVCMTFAARVGALRADRWLHWLWTVPHTPRDQKLWLTLQRLGPFRFLPRVHRRVLLSAVPGCATHLEDGVIASDIDWNAIAADTKQWAIEQGLPNEDVLLPS